MCFHEFLFYFIDCEANYNDMIREQKMLYSQSFSRVLHYIWNSETDIPNAALLAPGRFNEKYSRVIKDKFEVWNKDFKDICMTQRMYSIPGINKQLIEKCKQILECVITIFYFYLGKRRRRRK